MSTIIISVCGLLLVAYLFDLTSSRTKIPSVILLLTLGGLVKLTTRFLGLHIPDLSPILPVLGTIGLVMIVLEGSLELEVNRSKRRLIIQSMLMALLPIVILSLGFAFMLNYYFGYDFKHSLTNVIPFFVISSAIAIPTAKNLASKEREFITYESSLSDIFGVIFFNFVTLHPIIEKGVFLEFSGQVLVMILVSFTATIGLAFLLRMINHHVKFVPIILLMILIYFISKEYHLPSLIFIMLFGLFIGNLDEMSCNYKIICKLKPEILNKEVVKFRDLIYEFTFLIRALFFLLFGYLIEVSELFDIKTIFNALIITAAIFLLRLLLLLIFKLPLRSLLFIAPRGLISILLFLSIPVEQAFPIINRSLIIQVIVINALVMMFGTIKSGKEIISLSEINENGNDKAHENAVEIDESEYQNEKI